MLVGDGLEYRRCYHRHCWAAVLHGVRDAIGVKVSLGADTDVLSKYSLVEPKPESVVASIAVVVALRALPVKSPLTVKVAVRSSPGSTLVAAPR